MKKNKGFTLVEVIVVAVIVAVLALVAIQLYQGYVKESRKNTAENLAASAASYLQAGVNSIGVTATHTEAPSPLNPGSTWNMTLAGGNYVYFTAPACATITYDQGNSTVTAVVKDQTSDGVYKYK